MEKSKKKKLKKNEKRKKRDPSLLSAIAGVFGTSSPHFVAGALRHGAGLPSGTPTIALTPRDLSTRSTASLGGPPVLARYEETDSRICKGDSTLFYNAHVNTNVVGLIMDRTGDFDATARVPDSAAMGGEFNLVSSNLQEKGTLPMDKETFTENVPSDVKGRCELEGKHEQSMLSARQLFLFVPR